MKRNKIYPNRAAQKLAWQRRNRVKRNAEWREKYKSDPEYRDKLRAYFRDYRANNKSSLTAWYRSYYKGIGHFTVQKTLLKRRKNFVGKMFLISTRDITRMLHRQDFECSNPYCRKKITMTTKTLDHTVPVSKGGIHSKGNINLMCKSCNSIKHDSFFVRFIRDFARSLKRK